MKKCIVFDVDRTMVDSYLPELLSLQEAIENVTGKKISEEQMKKLTSLPTNDFFKFLNLTEEEVTLVNKEWENTFVKYKTKCFPHIKEVIKELFDRGFSIAIITSRTMQEFHELDEELMDVLKCFRAVITSDLIQTPKPDRESIDYLCNELQTTPEELIYIGDSEIDKLFSQNCNVDFIPACWENKELAEEENACNDPEMLMPRINDLISPPTNHFGVR